MKIKQKKNKPKYDGVSDFLRNASLEEKIKVFTKAAQLANEDQRKLFDKYSRSDRDNYVNLPN